jgi:hypothetical protein
MAKKIKTNFGGRINMGLKISDLYGKMEFVEIIDFSQTEKEGKQISNDMFLNNLLDFVKNMESNQSENGFSLFNDDLGEPTSVEYFEEDGLYFEKKTWMLQTGELVKLLASDKPFDENNTIEEEKTLSLEEELEIAIKNENYEKAVEIRDLINEKEKN